MFFKADGREWEIWAVSISHDKMTILFEVLFLQDHKKKIIRRFFLFLQYMNIVELFKFSTYIALSTYILHKPTILLL